MELPPPRLADGGEVPYLGERLDAARCASSAGRTRPHVARRGDELRVALRARTSTVRDALERWYRRRARAEVAPRLDAACAALGLGLHDAADPRPAHPLGVAARRAAR